MSWNLRVRSSRSGEFAATRSGWVLSAALYQIVSFGLRGRGMRRNLTVCRHLESAAGWKLKLFPMPHLCAC
jgi:hypothetical protein